jgi:uncharacterized protein YuzE
MTEPLVFEYHEQLDIINIQYDDYEDYEYSHEAQGFVADIDTNGHIIGIEVLDASEKLDFNGETSPELRKKVEDRFVDNLVDDEI